MDNLKGVQLKTIDYFLNEAEVIKERFDKLKKDYIQFFIKISDKKDLKEFNEFPGKRTPKIVKKLFNYPGDISPAMLVTLAKEIKENEDFYKGD